MCLIAAMANLGGNVFILLFYRPVFAWLNVPLPQDIFSFTFVCGFSFTAGVLALMVYRDPDGNKNLLPVGFIGKGIYAFLTFYFYYEAGLHWFYRVFGVFDGVIALVYMLFWLHLSAPDLARLSSGKIGAGLPRARTKRALLLGFSLTGNGSKALNKVKAGLAANGYGVDEKLVVSNESLFHFPFSFGVFLRIMFRAILRRPTTIRPLGIPADHDYDLIVVASQTWFVGVSAPAEAIFQDPANRVIFSGRDVAAVNVCRGLARRSQAQLVRHIERCGGNVVGARTFGNPGREPMRTFSLFFFLGYGKPGRPKALARWLTPQWLDDGALSNLEQFGAALANRPVASFSDTHVEQLGEAPANRPVVSFSDRHVEQPA
jgi:hypothetical protein